jgi:hypothetical protein
MPMMNFRLRPLILGCRRGGGLWQSRLRIQLRIHFPQRRWLCLIPHRHIQGSGVQSPSLFTSSIFFSCLLSILTSVLLPSCLQSFSLHGPSSFALTKNSFKIVQLGHTCQIVQSLSEVYVSFLDINVHFLFITMTMNTVIFTNQSAPIKIVYECWEFYRKVASSSADSSMTRKFAWN